MPVAGSAAVVVHSSNGSAPTAAGPSAAQRPAPSLVARVLPLLLVGLAAVTLIWTRLLGLTQGLWGDEATSVVGYIQKGPTGVFGNYLPNDHMLWELLTWASTGLLGDHSEAAYRLWSVLPALGAAALTTWWAWRRLGRWVAGVFLVLAAAAPLYLDLGTQARGYGLAFLASSAMLVGADRLRWQPSRAALALFAGSALVGIWTLPVFVLAFLACAAVLACWPPLRRDVLAAVLAVGALSLLFYAPVLGDLLNNSTQQFGSQLGLFGFLTGPLSDLLSPDLTLLAGNLTLVQSDLLAGLLVGFGRSSCGGARSGC